MEYINIGRTGKAHGTQGEIRFYIEAPLLPFIEELPALFFEEKGKFIPYFLEQIRGGDPPLLLLEEIKSRSDAKNLAGREVFARQKDLDLPAELFRTIEKLEYAYLVGYTLVDTEQGELGRIQAVEAYPEQEMAIVQGKAGEWLLPLTAAFIQSEDPKAKVLRVLLPEGLADI